MGLFFMELALFAAKSLILFILIACIFILFFGLIAKSKEKLHNRLVIKNLSKKYAEISQALSQEILPKKLFKHFMKTQKVALKEKNKAAERPQNVFVLNFNGDIKASAVAMLREEINALLQVATAKDEVIVRIESAGGMVHGYGLAAAQLIRIREKGIPLTVTVDKIAASGGYLMACVANKILAAPFAIIGSIGVLLQLPNFNRVLKEKNIDFEQHTAGEYKRTLTLFGENTEAAREKVQEELESIHHLFKKLISTYRPQMSMEKVATGEHWLGAQALELQLVDELKTSDDYLLSLSQQKNLYEISFVTRKTFSEKIGNKVNKLATYFLQKGSFL